MTKVLAMPEPTTVVIKDNGLVPGGGSSIDIVLI